ncbi:hypothetical protein Tsubulata_019503 [Turnera subulata]|uniref:NAB domain-containing protein n=1 Tax=Turnera subulata TaxID=218843 RepID=A0A9Q0FWI4_9ROSI|nr:hypothetical protein Tsubulata_019503 [Turnera subulata]
MDFEERMKTLLSEEDMGGGDTFAERAEWYYQKRPQLLALLQDLYNGYTTLLARCSRLEGKGKQLSHSSSMWVIDQDTLLDDPDGEVSDDAESSLSYQQQSPRSLTFGSVVDEMVADIVMKNVEKDILMDQVGEMEQQGQESWRKMDLLKKLLEVLESERMVLLNENGRLVYKVEALVEENKGLACDAMFLKRKAGELARCVLKMREDHRVCMLTRKIEDLQGQIYGLESRNKEYYQQLMMKKEQQQNSVEEEKSPSGGDMKGMKSRNFGGSGYLQVALVGCFQVEKLKLKRRDDEAQSYGHRDANVKSSGVKRVQKLWQRVKSMDLFMCGGLQQST